MDFGSLLIAVSASGAGGTVFLISFIFYHGLWHDFRSLDKPPSWFISQKLVVLGILRIRAGSEVYIRSFGENCIVFTALSYIALGFINFGAGVFSIILLNSIRDGTCQYAADMGNRCKLPNCTTPCGRPIFSSCGVIACDKLRCSSDVSAFLRIAGDPSSVSAADTFSTLQGNLTVVQVRVIASYCPSFCCICCLKGRMLSLQHLHICQINYGASHSREWARASIRGPARSTGSSDTLTCLAKRPD